MICNNCNGVIPISCCCSKSNQFEQFEAEENRLHRRICGLENAIRNMHKVRGRHHTQQACEALFALVGLDNNIGAQND